MPIYEYQCTACGHRFEAVQTMNDKALVNCTVCNEPKLQKLISAPAFHLKGTGWYATDFKDKGSAKPGSEGSGSKGEQAKEKEQAKPEEAKQEVKSESKDIPSSTSTTTKKPDKAD